MLFVTSCDMQGVTSDISEKKEKTEEVYITMEGGSGKAYVLSPVTVTKTAEGIFATLVWSSKNYDYVIVDDTKYENENPGGESTFTVPVRSLDEPFTFIADTVAMSTPHEIEYTIIWNDREDADEEKYSKERGFGTRPSDYSPPDLGGLSLTGQMELSHAKGYAVTEYGDYKLISIYGVGEYLLVPEGMDVPEGIGGDITILKKPLDKTYLVSTSVMDLIRAINALGSVTLSGKRADDWYIDEASRLMDEGKIVYAGKYRAPDYELILSSGCNFAIENTMIFHNPDVKEKLEELGIPVLVETSSYESDPLSRLEWIKLYGLLYDKEKEADEFFDKESARIEAVAEKSKSTDNKPTVAVFSMSDTGLVNVRSPRDYVAGMVEMAGGRYIPSDAGEGSSASVNIRMEDFYLAAKDADILIYNGTIDKQVSTLYDLISKDEMFADFDAVKNKRVYLLGSDFFQKTTGMADFVEDVRSLIDGSDRECVYIKKLE